ncbi:MAG: PIN domain-containing protein [Thermoprotei archaeon]
MIALLDETDKFHEEAISRVKRIREPRVPVMAISEVVWHMKKYGIPLTFLRDALRSPFSLVESTGEDVEFALSHPGLNELDYDDVDDLIILSCTKRRGLCLCTFDLDLKKRAQSEEVPTC